ncbi:MAG: hypothetical protein FWD31_07375 [Planctomycetaceae bacterium]|nr:hypothetical protein [Planctomycetaceae bacterium]
MKRFHIRLLVILNMTIILAVVLLCIMKLFVFIFGGVFYFHFQGVFILLFGWIAGIFRLLFGLFHEPMAVLIGMLALLLLPVMLHRFLRQMPTRKRNWRFRQSVAVAGILCSFVIMAFAMKAAMQNGYAIARPKEDLTERWSMGKRIDTHGNPLDDQPKQNPPRR